MGLSPGTRIGPYEVTAQLGVGGMGEVHRATDTRLKRQVAIKVLPESVAQDPDRLARFQREAEVLAQLNHPNIAAIHGLEESDGLKALVMELVEGPTLADRIAQGPIAVDEALPIAKQIAGALEAAHEQGIIHRDLKPANIKLRPDGTVKVLDFGLAKAMEPAGASTPLSMSMSPTITTPAMTQMGMILGTAAYMSPEQARGRAVDRRADIWAFGCVLFEMLTGEQPFTGQDVGETLASVIKDTPRLDALPAKVRPLVARCLEKDPNRRLRDIGDMDLLLTQQPSAAPTGGLSRLWPAAAVLFLAIAAGLAFIHFRETPPAQESLRFEIPPPGSAVAQGFTLSPDARQLAFIAREADGPPRLWVRAMDTLQPRVLAGTDGATYPFWSPDGRYLGFFAEGKLKKILANGGPAQTLCDAGDGRGGTWNRNDVIVFSPGPTSPIFRVSSAGGEAAPVTSLLENGAGHRFPAFLPDGMHFLFNSGSDDPEASGLFVGSLDGSAPVRLQPDATNAQYVSSGDERSGAGLLLFRREATLMAQPFDAAELRATAEMFPIAEQIAQGGNVGFGAFSAAADTLVYRTEGAGDRELIRVDRTGKRLNSIAGPSALADPSLSPDSRTLAVRINTGLNADLWLQDLDRSVLTRFTFRPGVNRNPAWSPDGSRVAFASQDLGSYQSVLFVKGARGEQEELLIQGGVNAWPTDWSPDGTIIVYQQQADAQAGVDLWLLPLEGDRTPMPYLQSSFNKGAARFAPVSQGAPRWMAYRSNESGMPQIYIQDIPATGRKFQVSTGGTDGNSRPAWRQDGKELFYSDGNDTVLAVPIALGTNPQIGAPQELFTIAGMTAYVPFPDGQTFLVNVPAGGAAGPAPITVVTNWQATVRK